MSDITYTTEQLAIIEAARSGSSLMVHAYAGSAKTTTLVAVANAVSWPNGLFLAFNIKIKQELEKRLPKHFTCMTLNGLGHRAWGKAIGKQLIVDEKKLGKILTEMLKRNQIEASGEAWLNALALVQSAMHAGLVPKAYPHRGLVPDTEEAWADIADSKWIELSPAMLAIARRTLEKSVELAFLGNVSFDDQIYMSCQPAGTLVTIATIAGGTAQVPIETIREGYEVVSFDRKTSSFIGQHNHASKVTAVASRPYTGILHTIATTDKQTQATHEHKWLTRFKPGLMHEDMWFTYLMYRDGSFRVGQTQTRSARPGGGIAFGLAQRAYFEKAEAAWILDIHPTIHDAKVMEAILVARFGITDTCFESDIGKPVHSICKQSPDLRKRATGCLELFHRDINAPFWTKNCTRSFDSNFITESSNLIPEIMQMPTFTGAVTPQWSNFTQARKKVENLPVYSLQVQRHELYVANGILTHNSIYNGVFPRFQHVLVDEAQDLSPLNHIQVARAAADQIIAVGDDKQAIYAFRGADSNSMHNLRKIRKTWTDLYLSTTFRCPKAVVARQQQHAPGFNAFHTNAEGNVENWMRINILRQNGDGWDWHKLIVLGQSPVAMLCRNNAPLLSMAFKLIRQRIGCTVLGRDIGKGLVALSKKIIPEDDTLAIDCMARIRAWREGQCDLAYANGKEEKIAGIVDRAECLQAVLEDANIENAKGLRSALEFLFSRSNGMVTLSSIHRAKGLEWPCVVHLDPWRIPSKYAQKQAKAGDTRQLTQEHNLQYVCETRAMHTLILASVEDFQ